MNAIVIEHVSVADLPAAWRSKLAALPEGQAAERVTVRIEAEAALPQPVVEAVADDAPIGVTCDHDDYADVSGYIRSIRPPLLCVPEPPQER